MLTKLPLLLLTFIVGQLPFAAVASAQSSGSDAPTLISAKKFAKAGEADWSSTDRILMVEPDANGIMQPVTMNPDGSDRHVLPTPNPERNTFHPAWHPSGQWFAVQRERDWHWYEWIRHVPIFCEVLLNGLWSDLYVAKADGSAWFQLTESSLSEPDGVLAPTFSPDGTKLMWSRLRAERTSQHPWGVYRLMLADFRIESGIPKISNIRDITPAAMENRFVESHGISPDGRYAVVASDLGAQTSRHMHIYRIDLATGETVRVSRDETWNEHATFTPDGQHIVYMAGVPGYMLSTDLVRVNLDGSGWVQLTHFNDRRYLEYAGEMVYQTHPRISPDGTQIVVTTQSVPRYPARDLWILTFSASL